MFDIIKLSSHYKAKHRFYFLKAYVRHYKRGCLNNEQSLLWDHICIWAGYPWRTESTIYGKCRQKYLSKLLKYSVQNIFLFDNPFLRAFISRCLFPMISSLLQSIFLIVSFPYLEEGEELNFPYPNFQKQSKENLSFPYITVSFPGKQSYILRTQG